MAKKYNTAIETSWNPLDFDDSAYNTGSTILMILYQK